MVDHPTTFKFFFGDVNGMQDLFHVHIKYALRAAKYAIV